MEECLEPDSISMTKEKLELDLISQNRISFSSASACVSVLLAAGSSVSRDRRLLSCIGVLSL